MSVAERPSASCSRTRCSRVDRCSSSVLTSSASWRCEWCSSSAATSRPARRSPEPGSPAAPPTCAWAQWRESRTDARLPTSGCSAARARVAPAVSGSPSQSRHSSSRVATLSGVGSASCSASSGQLLTQRPQPTQLRGSSARINSSPSPFFCCSGSWKKGPVTTGCRRATSAAVASKASSWAGRSSSDRPSCPASHVQPSRQASRLRLPASALASCPARRPARCLWARRRASAAGPCVPASWLAPVSRASVPSTLTPRAESGQAIQQRPQPLQASGSRTGRPGAASPRLQRRRAGRDHAAARQRVEKLRGSPALAGLDQLTPEARQAVVRRPHPLDAAHDPRQLPLARVRSREFAPGDLARASLLQQCRLLAAQAGPERLDPGLQRLAHGQHAKLALAHGRLPRRRHRRPDLFGGFAAGQQQRARRGDGRERIAESRLAWASPPAAPIREPRGRGPGSRLRRPAAARPARPAAGRVTRPRTRGPTSSASASASRRGASGGSSDSRPTRPAERTPSARGSGGLGRGKARLSEPGVGVGDRLEQRVASREAAGL